MSGFPGSSQEQVTLGQELVTLEQPSKAAGLTADSVWAERPPGNSQEQLASSPGFQS